MRTKNNQTLLGMMTNGLLCYYYGQAQRKAIQNGPLKERVVLDGGRGF